MISVYRISYLYWVNMKISLRHSIKLYLCHDYIMLVKINILLTVGTCIDKDGYFLLFLVFFFYEIEPKTSTSFSFICVRREYLSSYHTNVSRDTHRAFKRTQPENFSPLTFTQIENELEKFVF